MNQLALQAMYLISDLYDIRSLHPSNFPGFSPTLSLSPSLSECCLFHAVSLICDFVRYYVMFNSSVSDFLISSSEISYVGVWTTNTACEKNRLLLFIFSLSTYGCSFLFLLCLVLV